MSWLFLIFGGISVSGWPLGIYLSLNMPSKFWGVSLAIGSMLLSYLYLWLAQKSIATRIAYSVWTAIGALSILLVNLLLLTDADSIWRILSALPFILGIIVIKLTTLISF